MTEEFGRRDYAAVLTAEFRNEYVRITAASSAVRAHLSAFLRGIWHRC